LREDRFSKPYLFFLVWDRKDEGFKDLQLEMALGAMGVLLIRNLIEDQQGLKKGQAIEEDHQGRPQQKGDQVRLGCDSISGFTTSLH
jgi:hypothetical protein